MASKEKVRVIVKDKNGNTQGSMKSKVLTKLFSKLPAGTELVFSIDEGSKYAPQVVGDYITRSQMEGDVPPPPVDNKKPVVNAGEDQTVLPGAEVTLDGTATDLDGTIDRVEWHQISPTLPVVDLVSDSADATNVKFTAPQLTDNIPLIYEFMIEAFDNKGASEIDKIKVTVSTETPPPPPPEPTPGVIWNSDKVWNDGKPRTIKGVATDPNDPDKQYEMRAGADVQGKKELEIDGKGTAKQTGERYRQYIWNEPGHAGSQGGAE